jgi:hypothetical protein
MNKDYIIAGLTGILLFMLGYILGNKNSNPDTSEHSASVKHATYPNGPKAANTAIPVASARAPAIFKQQYWIQSTLQGKLAGYSLLFDSQVGRLFLLELCRATDYAAQMKNHLAQVKPCEKIYQGKIQAIDEKKVTIVDADQKQKEIEYEWNDNVLKINVKNQWVSMTVGTKGQLIQQFESDPSVMAAKKKWFEATHLKK